MNGAVFSECASDLGVRRVQRGGRLKRGGRTFSGVGEVKYGWKGVDGGPSWLRAQPLLAVVTFLCCHGTGDL